MKRKISFNIPELTGNEINNLTKLNQLKSFSANFFFTKKCQQWLKKNIKVKEVLLVHSCRYSIEQRNNMLSFLKRKKFQFYE